MSLKLVHIRETLQVQCADLCRDGGTFKSIAQRAWADQDKLLELSAQIAFKAEFTQSGDVQEFVQQFCKMEAR